MTDDDIAIFELAASLCTGYLKPEVPHNYSFNDDDLLAFARAIEARVLEELRKQGPVGFGCFDLAGFLDQDLVGTEADCIFWRDSPDATNKWTVKALFTAPIPTPSQEEALDAKRWRYYADCPQTALMLGTELDPNSEQDWAAECSRLVDASLARPDTEGSGK